MKSKASFLLQAMIWLMILGLSFKSIGTRIMNPTSISTYQHSFRIQREKPLEVPYSTFMDMMESHGKSTLRVDNVIIGKERIGFRVSTPSPVVLPTTTESTTSPSSITLKDIPILSSSSQSTSRFVYTRKIDASPTLIDFLRQQKITFTAASTTATNTLSKVFSSAVVLVYFLVVLRMYRVMTGGGSGNNNNDTPGKLAQFRKKKNGKVGDTTDEPIVSFEDIRGMDGPKYEVMELVDTLRFPDKYAIFGARAPRGLLLEGPPGTVSFYEL
jgi:ATP-dependent Zn protease